MPLKSMWQLMLLFGSEKRPVMKAGNSYAFLKAIEGVILIMIPRLASVYLSQVYHHR